VERFQIIPFLRRTQVKKDPVRVHRHYLHGIFISAKISCKPVCLYHRSGYGKEGAALLPKLRITAGAGLIPQSAIFGRYTPGLNKKNRNIAAHTGLERKQGMTNCLFLFTGTLFENPFHEHNCLIINIGGNNYELD
jgi:hypothetical protein